MNTQTGVGVACNQGKKKRRRNKKYSRNKTNGSSRWLQSNMMEDPCTWLVYVSLTKNGAEAECHVTTRVRPWPPLRQPVVHDDEMRGDETSSLLFIHPWPPSLEAHHRHTGSLLHSAFLARSPHLTSLTYIAGSIAPSPAANEMLRAAARALTVSSLNPKVLDLSVFFFSVSGGSGSLIFFRCRCSRWRITTSADSSPAARR